MGKSLPHRMRRWLRLALCFGLVSQGTLSPPGIRPASAAQSDTIAIGVTPGSSAPPASISDLLASANPSIPGQVSLTWTAPQGNVGGVPLNNQSVLAYTIRYSTVSVVALGGNTVAWWNTAASNSITLQGPSNTPKAPGQLESYALAGLPPNQTIWFAVKSISQSGVISPIDTKAASPSLQAYAFTGTTTPDTPRSPYGLIGAVSNGLFSMTWRPVTVDLNYTPILVDHYRVERYGVIGGSVTASVILPVGANTFSDAATGSVNFYRVYAVSTQGVESPASDYIDSSDSAYVYSLASDDSSTRVVLPRQAALQLLLPNSFGEDLEVKVTRRPQDETNTTLRSYHMGLYRALSGIEVTGFAFLQNEASVHLGYGAAIGSSLQLGSQPLGFLANAGISSVLQIISVYWFNGSSYVRMGDPLLTADQSLAISVRNLGTYQLRAVRIGDRFQLTQGSPYPRIITPNDPSQNNRVFFFFDNPAADTVKGTIYDIRGAKVRDLSVDGMSPTSNSIVWDGKDSNNAVVPSGVYLYKITAGKESLTGTVVVAR